MSPQDDSRQKLRNCVYICQSYSEKTIGFFFPKTKGFEQTEQLWGKHN